MCEWLRVLCSEGEGKSSVCAAELKEKTRRESECVVAEWRGRSCKRQCPRFYMFYVIGVCHCLLA